MARDFDGVNDEIYNTAISNIDTDLMSVSLWFMVDSGETGIQNLFMTASDKSAGNRALELNVDATGLDVQAIYAWSTTNANRISSIDIATLGIWHHYACTYDRSSTSNVPSVWIDGIAIL